MNKFDEDIEKRYQVLRENEEVQQHYEVLKEYATGHRTYPRIKERRYDLVAFCIGYYGMITEECYNAINLLAYDQIIDY